MGPGSLGRWDIRAIMTSAVAAGFAMLATSSAAAQTVTFGADVSQPPMATGHGCAQRPDSFGDGGWISQPTPNTSCTWTTVQNAAYPAGSLITPGGTGTITHVRIRVGASTGPMQLVVMNFEYDPSNGNANCCNAAYVSQPFTPTPDSITTLNTNLPVHTDEGGQESAPPYEVGDLLALNIDENTVAIPLIDYTNQGLTFNNLPADDIHWPAYVQGQTDVIGSGRGYQLDMNADWVSGTSNPPPTPSVSVGGSKPTVKHGKVNVGLDCGAAAACNGNIAIENVPLAGATAASKKHKKKTIIYANGTFSLAAGQNGTVAVPLKGKGKTAAKRHKKLAVYIDITVGSKKVSKRVTFKF